MFNPELDLESIAKTYFRDGRVVITNALPPDVADSLHAELSTRVPWSLAYRRGDESKRMDAGDYAALSGERRRLLLQEAYEEAASAFQFVYESYMLITAYLEDPDMPTPLKALVETLNSVATRQILGTLVGRDDVRKVDGQATCYRSGHFLTYHDDRRKDHGRLAAYVLNLTPNWRSDWGGLLHFMDPTGRVSGTVVPAFNQLTLFRVPQGHCVSLVAPFASAPRLSITGWLRSE